MNTIRVNTGPRSRLPRLFHTLPFLLFCFTGVWNEQARADESAPAPEVIEAAVQRGVRWIGGQARHGDSGYEALAALSLLKGGETEEHPLIIRTLERIHGRAAGSTYQPGPHHYYEAGVELMLLLAIDPERHRLEMETIAQYVMAGQKTGGHWYYPNQNDSGGDTSITQYALLGLWAASEGGIPVSPQFFDEAAGWHLKTQLPDGGWAYHPGDTDIRPRSAMTAAAMGSLYLARRQLYGDAAVSRTGPRPTSAPRKRFGILEPLDPAGAETPGKPAGTPQRYNPKTALNAIDAAIERGNAWLAGHDDRKPLNGHHEYFQYALERVGAFGKLEKIGERDWYARGAQHFLTVQTADGSFGGDQGASASTSFAILFLTRATAKQLNRPEPPPRVGAGLLAGGRGLPENLAAVDVRGGQVKSRKLAGPLDELLRELENPQSLKVESAQKAVVENVQLGDREGLIGQSERLRRLASDPRPEVRRTALWALGRSSDISVGPILIAALTDPDLDVVVEAHNALSYLSRRPLGGGIPAPPAVAADESAEARAVALAQWRATAQTRWKQWYRTVRPYEERDDLPEPKSRSSK